MGETDKFSEADFLLLRDQDDQYILDNMELLKSKIQTSFSQEELNALLRMTVKDHPFSQYVIALLVDSGADVDHQDEDGDTTLHLALSYDDNKVDCEALEGRREILIEALLHEGARLDIRNVNKKTALDVISENEEDYPNIHKTALLHQWKLMIADDAAFSGIWNCCKVHEKESIVLRKSIESFKETWEINLEIKKLVCREVKFKGFQLLRIFAEWKRPAYMLDEDLVFNLNKLFGDLYPSLAQCFPFFAPVLGNYYKKAKRSKYYWLNMAANSCSSANRKPYLKNLPIELRFAIFQCLNTKELEMFILSE